MESDLSLEFLRVTEQAAIACLVGAGDTKTGPLILGGVALVNIPLAWSCFHGLGPIPEMGFYGIGMGTALSHACGSMFVLGVLVRGRFGLRLRPAELWPDFPLLYRILRISMPASVDTLSIGLCQLWFLSLVNGLGDVAATAHGTAIRCEGLGYMSGQAFATAAAALGGGGRGSGGGGFGAERGAVEAPVLALAAQWMAQVFPVKYFSDSSMTGT